MKKESLVITCLFILFRLHAQPDDRCLPKQLIVVAENLNFRTGPNTNSDVIAKLDNAESLTFIEIHGSQDSAYWNTFDLTWVKVKRNRTGEIGYVFKTYVKNAEMAYLRFHDVDRIQSGNWYGIYHEGGKVKIEKTIPNIVEIDTGFDADGGFGSIQGSSDKHKILICSQTALNEGEINGQLFDGSGESRYLKIGDYKQLIRIDDFQFSLVCTGEVSLDPPYLVRKNEKIIFVKEEIDGSRRYYSQQDLTNCIAQFGEVGYKIHFAGDLNHDGIPELIISEATTHGSSVYYFQSNQDGKLELASITGVTSKC